VDRSLPQFQVIGELRGPLTLFDGGAVIFVICALLWIGALWRCRRDSWGAFALVFGGASVYLAWSARRNVTVAAVAACVCAALLMPRLGNRRVRAWLALAALAIFAALAADCWMGKRLQPWSAHPESRLSLDERELPVGALRHLEQIGFRGQRYVDLNIGAYDSFVRGPDARSLVDARLEVLGGEGLRAYLRTLQDGPFFEATCEQFGLEAAIIDRRKSHQRALLDYLSRSPDWVSVYSDAEWTTFLKRASANRLLLE
jgi:hypothetical protein